MWSGPPLGETVAVNLRGPEEFGGMATVSWWADMSPTCLRWLVSGKMGFVCPCSHLLTLLSLSRYDADLWLVWPSPMLHMP